MPLDDLVFALPRQLGISCRPLAGYRAVFDDDPFVAQSDGLLDRPFDDIGPDAVPAFAGALA